MPPALATLVPQAVAAQEIYGGVYAHGVDTPFTLDTQEGGTAIQLGYRFAPVELPLIGGPEPYVFRLGKP